MRIKFKRLKNSKRKKLENICKLIDYLQIKKIAEDEIETHL